jgi:hypothetical protein
MYPTMVARLSQPKRILSRQLWMVWIPEYKKI